MTKPNKEQLDKWQPELAINEIKDLIKQLALTAMYAKHNLGRNDIEKLLIETAMKLESMIDD